MEVIKPDGVYESSSPNSRAVVHDDIVYVSGIVGYDRETNEYGDSMTEQTRLAFENIEATLDAAGSSPDQILRLEVFYRDADLKPEMDEVFREYLDEPFPTRAALVNDFSGDALLEVVVTAHR